MDLDEDKIKTGIIDCPTCKYPNNVARVTCINCSNPFKGQGIKGYDERIEAKNVRQGIIKDNILHEAHGVIYGDREKTYGAPDKNLKVIANLWSSYLGRPITVDDVCIMMILLKAARLKNDPTHRDSQVDMCGYAALMERVQDYERSRNSVASVGAGQTETKT